MSILTSSLDTKERLRQTINEKVPPNKSFPLKMSAYYYLMERLNLKDAPGETVAEKVEGQKLRAMALRCMLHIPEPLKDMQKHISDPSNPEVVWNWAISTLVELSHWEEESLLTELHSIVQLYQA